MNDFTEEQGPVRGWCQEIRLFREAATMAGSDLNRRTFVEAMSRTNDLPPGRPPQVVCRHTVQTWKPLPATR